MKFLRILALVGLPVYLCSCHTTQRLPNYLENITDTSGKYKVKIPELRIQTNDLLSIQVYSLSTLPGADELYNMRSTGATAGSPAGLLVDVNGNIEYPRLGSFHAAGLTKTELAAQIKKRLTEPVELLKSPSVIIRFLNYKVMVSGEVANGGEFTVPGERITILEAIGKAGGITEYGKKEVKVIREYNGIREIGTIDLSKDFYDSPYFNLMQNDIVLVEPTERKAKQADQALVTQRISFALSLITALAFIYNIFK
ncbi:MAG TPA: polysaccharide biosynthesis/export family protein [Chitinophagaceae bacterium]|nr:polysaccharide biosynthesis/export family protein [Chitinophagaceae bacterium]